MAKWFLDFEGFSSAGKFWIKELCILPLEGDFHYNYFIKSNKMNPSDCDSYNWQFQRHGLRSSFGDYYFNEAIRDVQYKVGDGIVLIKGREKALQMENYFNVEELPESLCSFKKSDACSDKYCNVKHNKVFCAQRKCYLLKHYYNL
jgi:hypothetical protein